MKSKVKFIVNVKICYYPPKKPSPLHLHRYSCQPSFHGSLDLRTVFFSQLPIRKLDIKMELFLPSAVTLSIHPSFLRLLIISRPLSHLPPSTPNNLSHLSL